jgi:hypothetical protein
MSLTLPKPGTSNRLVMIQIDLRRIFFIAFCMVGSLAWLRCHVFFCNFGELDFSKTNEACLYIKSFNYSNTNTIALALVTKISSEFYLPPNFAVQPCDSINTCRA